MTTHLMATQGQFAPCCGTNLYGLDLTTHKITNNPQDVTCHWVMPQNLSDTQPATDPSAFDALVSAMEFVEARDVGSGRVVRMRLVPADAVVLPMDVLPRAAQFDVWARQVASTVGYGWADELGQALEIIAASVEAAELVQDDSAGVVSRAEGVSGRSVAASGQDEAVPSEPTTPDPALVRPARPEVVTLCGSTRFKGEFERVNRELTMQGKIVISLGVFGHAEMPDYNWDDSDLKQMLDQLHKAKINLADRVHVINPELYLGVSTRCEIRYAYSLGIPVTFEHTMTDDHHGGTHGLCRHAETRGTCPGVHSWQILCEHIPQHPMPHWTEREALRAGAQIEYR